MPLGGLALHLSSLDVERRVQRQRAIASILKAVPFQTSGRQRQHWIQAVQCLNRGLLIHTKHNRVLRWSQVQSDHVGSLGLEIRIVTGKVGFKWMRAYIG